MGKRIFFASIGLMLALIVLVPTQTAAQVVPDQRFGMTEVFWLPEEARELGVGWERILFYWREIQPQGPDDWNTLHVLEEWLVDAEQNGREVVGLIKNTAPWASIDGTEAGLPRGLDLPPDDPDNLWANYVGRLADYYGPRGVHHWIIWNEPEIEPGVYGYEFGGTAADYYQMLKTAYRVMKQRDPQAVIHLAGLTWWHDPTFLERFLAIAAADPEADENNHYFDVISLHIYFRTETVRSIIEEVNAIQGRFGLQKPIWINETNAPPNRDPDWPVNRPRFNIDLEQQAWFIVQAMALGFASGAERISVYKLVDIHLPPGGESFGLVRPDGSRRPAFDAFKLVTRCFGDFDEVTFEEDPRFYRITFSRPGGLTHTIWSRTPVENTVRIGASAEIGTVLRISGVAEEVVPEEGMFTLQLPGQRCNEECLVGGEPLLLLEALEGDFDAESCLRFQAADSDSTSTPTATKEPPKPTAVATAELTPETAKATPVAVAGAGSSGRQEIGQPEVAPSSEALAVVEMTPVVVAPAEIEESTTALADAESVEAGGDNQAIPVGLWLLGLGAGLALVLTFFVIRTKIDRTA